MAAKLTRLTHKIVIQLYLVAESCTTCSSYSKQAVQKLLDMPSYFFSTNAIITQIPQFGIQMPPPVDAGSNLDDNG